jgi:hypothetical protein
MSTVIRPNVMLKAALSQTDSRQAKACLLINSSVNPKKASGLFGVVLRQEFNQQAAFQIPTRIEGQARQPFPASRLNGLSYSREALKVYWSNRVSAG